MTFRLRPLTMAIIATFGSQLAYAQTTTTTDQAVLPTVTVNASADASADGLPGDLPGGQVAKGSRNGVLGNVDNLDSAFKTTSYTNQLITDQQAHGVSDILSNDPVVRATRGYGNYQEAYMIRGFIAFSDDMMYNGLYGILPRQYVSSEMIERVEVLYGASAFLNGAAPGDQGLGGSINVVPKRAANEPLTEVTFGFESGNQKYASLDLSRRMGPEDRLGIRVNAARHAGGTGVSGESKETNLLTIGADYRGNDFRLSADFGYQENNIKNGRPSLYLGSGLTAIPSAPSGSTNYGQKWSYSNERDLFGTVRGEWDLSDNTTAWAAFGARQGHENNSLATPTLNSTDGSASYYRFDNARQDDVATGEVGIRTKLKTGGVSQNVSAVVSSYWQDSRNAYAYSDYNALSTNIYSPTGSTLPALTSTGGGDLSNPQTTTKTQLWSAALADTLGFYDDKVLLTLGLRYQSVAADGYSYGTAVQSSHYNQGAVSPMAGLAYKFTKNLTAYANYIQGLQQGTQVVDTSAANYGAILSPYKTKQKEVGLKYQLGGGYMTAAYFTTDKPNYYTDTTTKIAGTNGLQRNRGIELSAVGEVAKGVRLLSGLTLLDARQEQTSGGTYNGKYALGVARRQFNLGMEYDVPGVSGLTLNGRANYTGEQYADNANTLRLPSYMTFDIGGRYLTDISGRAVTFRAGIKNLTNKAYWASAGGSGGYGYLVEGDPRTFQTSVSVAF